MHEQDCTVANRILRPDIKLFQHTVLFQVSVTYMLPEQDNTQKINVLEIRFLHQTPHIVNSQ